MLLNHTSGIFDYAYDYSYSANLLSNQDKIITYLELLCYAYDKKSEFEHCSKYTGRKITIGVMVMEEVVLELLQFFFISPKINICSLDREATT
ncbi:MAG: hypothetical protein WCP85_19065 [Mariniphaga sp.]